MKLCAEFGKRYFEVEVSEKDYNYIYSTIENYYNKKIDNIIDESKNAIEIIDRLYHNFTKVQHILYGYFDCLENQNLITQFENTFLSSIIIDEFFEHHQKVLNDLT